MNHSSITVSARISGVLCVRRRPLFVILSVHFGLTSEKRRLVAMSEGVDLWYVKLANGDVHRVTVDQLDGAFQAGHIDERTMVLACDASDSTAWTSLGVLLGLDAEPAPAPSPEPAPRVAAPAAAYGYAAPVATPMTYVAVAPVVSMPSQAPVAAHRSVPPAVANSLRPMSMDLGMDDLDDAPFRRRSGGRWAVAALGLAAIAGVAGFFATRAPGGQGDDIGTMAAAAAMAAPHSFAPTPLPETTPAPIVPPSPAATTAPSTAAQGPVEASPLNPQFTDRFNETQKEKLLAADKAREDKAKARHSAGSWHPAPKYKSAGFTTGGNKYDPLNSNL
jgi:hypothetical protein